MFARFAAALAAMIAVVTASNILVQFPLNADLGPLHLGDFLTWGAFTYPFAFLVSDLTNRFDGPKRARAVVVAGFAVALCLSAYLSTPRIAIASATAFLIGQLLDIAVFSRLRNRFWLLPPLSASLLGSLIVALFWRRLGARATMAGMIASVLVMCFIYWPANIPATRDWWTRTFGGTVFWPWFTLIGTLVTLGVAWLVRALWPERAAPVALSDTAETARATR